MNATRRSNPSSVILTAGNREITEEQLKFLSEKHAERFEAGSVYYIDQRTLEMYEGINADAGLLKFLRRALGQKDDVELTWVRNHDREST